MLIFCIRLLQCHWYSWLINQFWLTNFCNFEGLDASNLISSVCSRQRVLQQNHSSSPFLVQELYKILSRRRFKWWRLCGYFMTQAFLTSREYVTNLASNCFLLGSKRHFSPFECGVIVRNEMLSMRELLSLSLEWTVMSVFSSDGFYQEV